MVKVTMGTGSFPGVKRPGCGADPPTSKCRGHERVGLYLYSLSGPSWPVIGRTFTLTLWLNFSTRYAYKIYWGNIDFLKKNQVKGVSEFPSVLNIFIVRFS